MESSTIVKAEDFYKGKSGECIIEFTEIGYTVKKDTRTVHTIEFLNKQYKEGYLHVYEDSAEEITEACRNQIVKYFYNHDTNMLPDVGATVTERYFKGLSREEAEAIGNEGKKAYYNY